MSFTRNNRIICDECGKFCRPFDEETPYGCVYSMNGDIEGPLDPRHYCEPCSAVLHRRWKEMLLQPKYWGQGCWMKSDAERRAAAELNLVWLASGVGTFGTSDYVWAHQYIKREEYERLSKLPKYVNAKS